MRKAKYEEQTDDHQNDIGVSILQQGCECEYHSTTE